MSARRAAGVAALLALGAGAGLGAAGVPSASSQEPTTPTTATTAPTTTTAPTATTTPPVPAPAPPTASTGTATAVTATGARLSASVGPNGRRTQAAFEYGTSTSYGATSAAIDAGDSTSTQAVAGDVSGLRAATTYHYRVRATSDAGTTLGADRTFRTAAAPAAARPPALSGTRASATGPTTAAVASRVDTRGRATRVAVEYGTTSALGSATGTVSAGSSGARMVTVPLGGLRPGTTYRARVVASSDGGTTRSGLVTFTTRTPNAITLTASPARIVVGSATTLSGRLTGTGSGGALATLTRSLSPFTTAIPLGAVTTSSSGAFSLQATPVVRTRYAVAAAPAGGQPVAAATRSVYVEPRVTVRSRRLRGGRTRLAVRVVPALGGRASLRRVGTDGRLVVVGGATLRRGERASTATLTRRLRAGRFAIRVAPATSTGLVTGTSAVVQVP